MLVSEIFSKIFLISFGFRKFASTNSLFGQKTFLESKEQISWMLQNFKKLLSCAISVHFVLCFHFCFLKYFSISFIVILFQFSQILFEKIKIFSDVFLSDPPQSHGDHQNEG